MNGFEAVVQTVQVFDPELGRLYSLDAAAYLTGVSRRAVLLYCRSGLIQPRVEPNYGSLLFDDDAIRTIRQAETFRVQSGSSVGGVRLVFELMREVESLRQELRFLRGV